MKKLFISQPMRGKSDEEILAEQQESNWSLQQEMIGEPVEVIDSFIPGSTRRCKTTVDSLENPWNFCQEQMWRICAGVGRCKRLCD